MDQNRDFDVFALTSLSPISRQIAQSSKLAETLLGLHSISHQIVQNSRLAETVLGLHSISHQIVQNSGLAEAVLGLHSVGRQIVQNSRLAETVLGLHSIGHQIAQSKNLADTVSGVNAIARQLGQSQEFVELSRRVSRAASATATLLDATMRRASDVGIQGAISALMVPAIATDGSTPADGVVAVLDQGGLAGEQRRFLEALLAEFRRVRMLMARDPISALSLALGLLSIFMAFRTPESTNEMREAIQQQGVRQSANHQRLLERLDRLDQLASEGTAANEELQKQVSDLADELVKAAHQGVASQVRLIVARTPLRAKPRSNGAVIQRMIPGTVCLSLKKHKRWVFIIAYDNTGEVMSAGWVVSSSLSPQLPL